MNMKMPPAHRASLAALLLGLAPAAMHAEMNNPRANRSDPQYQQSQSPSARDQGSRQQTQNESRQQSEFRQVRQASQDPRGSYAGDLIGTEIVGADQTRLGTVNDFIVDAQSGRVLHAVVASGGVLGVGANLRVVPIGALSPSQGRMVIDVDQQRWEQAPVFTKDQLPSLSQEARGRQIYEYFGQRQESQRGQQQFALVTDLRGKDIRSADQKVGEIEDVIISLNSRRAGALVDLSDDFFAGDQKFVVPLARFSNFQQRNLSTSLTREDFSRVAPRSNDASGNRDWDAGGIFAWSQGAAAATERSLERGADRVSDATERTADRVSDAGERAGERMSDAGSRGAPPVAAVQRAVQADARSLGVKAENIQVRAERDKVVIRGTVPSEAAKDRIEDGAERAAPGWSIDNQLKVSSSDDL